MFMKGVITAGQNGLKRSAALALGSIMGRAEDMRKDIQDKFNRYFDDVQQVLGQNFLLLTILRLLLSVGESNSRVVSELC
jgi:hypothetical protein